MAILRTYSVTFTSTDPLWLNVDGGQRTLAYSIQTYKEPEDARQYIKAVQCFGGQWRLESFREENPS